MSTDIAIRQPTALTNDQLQTIANTEFVPKGLRGNLPAILACVAMGRELGIGDMAAMNSIHLIEGKPTLSAELMVQLVRRHGHSITGEIAEGSATVTGTRADTGDTMTSTWTLAMAERAGLAGKQNWKRYPESMLWARAVSQLCRMLFADCFAGATYTTEELGAEETDSYGVPYQDDDRLFPPLDAGAHERAAGSAAAPPPGADPNRPSAPSGPEDPSTPEAAPSGPDDYATDPQKRKLDVLVAKLRTPGHITTEHLYRAVDPNGEDDWPRDGDGDLHWSDLRETLTKDEASSLIERLIGLEQRVTT